MGPTINPRTAFRLAAGIALLLFACKREKETLSLPENDPQRIAELMPMQKGKYITYRLDSTVTIRQGRALEVRRYQVKDVWDSLLTDNQGQPTWRVFRYINDSVASKPWQPLTTYTTTPYDNRVEITENNLRSVRLQLPLRQDAVWKGNRFLPFEPYGKFNNVSFTEVNNWDFTYTGQSTEQIGGVTLNNVWTVQHLNEVADTLSMDNASIRYYTLGFSEDKYAPGIGLVARQLQLIENNPNRLDATTYDPYKAGFAIRMWMIDHN